VSASKPFAVGATVQHRRNVAYIPPPENDPVTAFLARGRKGDFREGELLTAEHIAAGIKRRKVTGIYKVRP